MNPAAPCIRHDPQPAAAPDGAGRPPCQRLVQPARAAPACATHNYERGVDLVAIQQLLGHWTVSSTMRYVRPSATFIEDAYRRRWPPRSASCPGRSRRREHPVEAADGRGAAGGVDRDPAAAAAGRKSRLEMSAASVSALFTRKPAQVKLSTLAASCTALECTPNDLFEVDTTPVARPAAPARPASDQPRLPRPGAGRCRPFDQRCLMGKKQRDCAGCGAPVGIIGREHCCLCWRKITEAVARSTCPACGNSESCRRHGRCVLCSRVCTQCGHPVRRADAALCRDCRARPGRRQPSRPARGAADRVSAGGYWLVRPVLPAPPAERPTPAVRAMRQVKRHEALGLCSACWQRRPERPFVQAAHLAARLADPPGWLDGFIAHLAAVHGSARACTMITGLAGCSTTSTLTTRRTC